MNENKQTKATSLSRAYSFYVLQAFAVSYVCTTASAFFCFDLLSSLTVYDKLFMWVDDDEGYTQSVSVLRCFFFLLLLVYVFLFKPPPSFILLARQTAFHGMFVLYYYVYEYGWQFVKMWISGTNYGYEMECICYFLFPLGVSLFFYIYIIWYYCASVLYLAAVFHWLA